VDGAGVGLIEGDDESQITDALQLHSPIFLSNNVPWVQLYRAISAPSTQSMYPTQSLMAALPVNFPEQSRGKTILNESSGSAPGSPSI